MITDWSRRELKMKARNILKFTFLKSLGAWLIYFGYSIVVSVFRLGHIPFFGLVDLVIKITIIPVLLIGVYRFYILVGSGNEPDYKNIFSVFSRENYSNVLKTIFVYGAKIFLWSLALVIPGIYKSYEYRMVPFILADNPEISTKGAFQISKEMMDGNKFNVFKLDFSFCGWSFAISFIGGLFMGFSSHTPNAAHLSMYTNDSINNIAYMINMSKSSNFGFAFLVMMILFAMLFVYYRATYAQLYLMFRRSAIESGIASEE